MTLSNNPPDMAVTAGDVSRDISGWMAENPVIETEEQSKAAKLLLDRGKLCIADLEDERKAKNQPFEAKIAENNDHYRSPREILRRVTDEISERLRAFLRTEERRRTEAAAEARRIAEEAQRKAREAVAAHEAAVGSARVGELGVDIEAHVVETNDAIRNAQVATRAAARAEKETNVKVSGGLTRALGLRTKEELVLVNASAALSVLGITDGIKSEILKAARAYRKLSGHLPEGVVSHTED